MNIEDPLIQCQVDYAKALWDIENLKDQKRELEEDLCKAIRTGNCMNFLDHGSDQFSEKTQVLIDLTGKHEHLLNPKEEKGE